MNTYWKKSLKYYIKAWMDSNSEYKEYAYLCAKYGNIDRFTQQKIIFAKSREFIVPDAKSFLDIYYAVFVQKIYKFIPVTSREKKDTIRILDLGANIGISVLWFCDMYPNAIIDAYEADAEIFHVLKDNIYANGLSENVRLFNFAVYNKNTSLSFFSEGADSGRILESTQDNNCINVRTIDVAEILEQYEQIDFLKMDIEGAERYVIPRMRDHLHKVKKIFIEYHSEKNHRQCLREIVDVLDEAGFRLYIQDEYIPKNPFLIDSEREDFDLQLDIFGVRI